jgi:hypothetical protein
MHVEGTPMQGEFTQSEEALHQLRKHGAAIVSAEIQGFITPEASTQLRGGIDAEKIKVYKTESAHDYDTRNNRTHRTLANA